MRMPLRFAACLATLIALSWRSPVLAQAPAPAAAAPAFEVASVKPSNPNPASPLGGVPMIMPVGGRFSATNVPLRLLIRLAYGVQDFQLVGGSSAQLSQKFDIIAKPEDSGATPAQMMAMLKTLLADRFKLRVHTETRDVPTATLVIARSDGRLGPNLTPSTADCSNAQAEAMKRAEAVAKGGPGALAAILPRPGETIPCSIAPITTGGFGLRGNGQPLLSLVALLTQATGRTVQDKTGLSGLFDFELRFDPEVLMRLASQAGVNLPAGVTMPPSDAPSLLTALQEQLGLKLESQRGSGEVLVIDSVEPPTAD